MCADEPARQRLVLPDGRAVSDDRSRSSRSSGCRDGAAEAGRMAMAFYFLLFFGIDLLFYAGSYNYGADVRYSLVTYPPLAVLGGLGAGSARPLGRARSSLDCRAWQALTAAVAFQFLWCTRRSSVRRPRKRGRRARTCGSRGRSCPTFRGNSYVLTHNPGMFQRLGRQCRADVAGGDEPSVSGRSRHALSPAGSICTGISGATCRIRFSGRSVPRSSSSDRPSACASTGNRTSTTSCTVSRAIDSGAS